MSIASTTDGRYLVQPLGLSYDDLAHAAIVASKRENAGCKVLDRETGAYLSRKDLTGVLRGVTPVAVAPPAPDNLSFSFESTNSKFPLLITLWGD